MIWLIVVSAILIDSLCLKPIYPQISYAELKRRAAKGDKVAGLNLSRLEQYQRIGVVLGFFQLMLAIAGVMLAVRWGGFGVGAVYAGLVLVGFLTIAQALPRWSASQWLYKQIEKYLLIFSQKITKFTPWLKPREKPALIGSKSDLREQLANSPDALSVDDQRRLKHALGYSKKTAADIMKPWQQVVSVKQAELLGPLMLDELHKTGSSIFPVVQGRAVVGLLDITQLTTLDNKRSVTAKKAMQPILQVSQTASLDETLKELVISRQSRLLVVDEDKKPVGLVSLNDVLQKITGLNYSSD